MSSERYPEKFKMEAVKQIIWRVHSVPKMAGRIGSLYAWDGWHVQAGTLLHVLQELGGWESVGMVQKYAHLSSNHLAEYMNRGSHLRSVDGYDLATVPGIKRGLFYVTL